jgi:hypothetical protein
VPVTALVLVFSVISSSPRYRVLEEGSVVSSRVLLAS